ncbi:MAG TPA: 30S ribosomal protein S7 [Candidatus Saccharimonadales bacterium]|nr:30S ribosomal protein S7 [Candidatus Saccharimonadales bacterium]
MRSGNPKKRPTQTDVVFKSRVVARMINTIMKAGKKSIAEKIVYSALDQLSQDKKEAVTMFEQAVKNVMPLQEVRSRRVGGATYQVPQPVRHERAEALAVRWIVDSAAGKKGKPMVNKLYEELKNAFDNTGSAIKKREDVHKMAEANRAFSHFRF